MNPINNVLKMHFRDKRTWFITPWMIMGLSFIINLIISYYTKELYTGGLSSFYIFVFVAGIITLTQVFPFAIGFSVRRTDFVVGTAITIIIASALNSFGLVLLSVVESNWLDFWGTNLHFFHLPYWSDGAVFVQLWISFITMLQFFFLGFLIASVHRRLGTTGIFALFIVLSVLITVLSLLCTANDWWSPLLSWVREQTALDFSLWMVPLFALYGLFSFLLLRRATVQ